MVKVQWRVVFLVTVILVGWLSAAESNRRKVIIHIPHLHHAHKQTVRHIQKGHSHGKANGKGNGHVHKHHHHFYDEDHGGSHGEPSHAHYFEEPGHHHHHPHTSPPVSHHHHPPPPVTHHHHPHPPPPPPPTHHGHHSHPPHHHHHHHPDHHSHSTHHVEHHRHPDHLDDLDHHHHHLRSEESMYSYDHHYPDHSHHRVNHYSDHHHHPSTRSYDCMEICEKCRMKANRHRYSVSRGHDVTRSSGGTPHPSQSVSSGSPPPPPPTSPAPSAHHQGYLVSESQEFKPALAPGELSAPAGDYAPGYVFPRPIEVLPSPGKLSNPGRKPVQYQDQTADFDNAFPDFPDFVPDTRNWYNETFFYGKHEDPGVKVVNYHRQRGQQVHQRGALRYNEDGLVNNEEGTRKERGRDLRFHNRHRYETINR